MVRHTLKILQKMLEDFQSVFDHFGTLGIQELKKYLFFICYFVAALRSTLGHCRGDTRTNTILLTAV